MSGAPARQRSRRSRGPARQMDTAPGTAAAAATAPRRPSSTGHAAANSHPATVALSGPTATATRPRTVARPASGTTTRLASTPMVESWLKWARPIGSTASWAATLIASAAARPRCGSGASTMPAVAANES